jgi:hypothetical protein
LYTAEVGWRPIIRFLQADVIQAVPLEKDLAALDIHLLDYPVEDPTIHRATHGREVHLLFSIYGEQRGILGCNEKLVMVPLITVAGPDPGYLLVGAIGQDVLALPVPAVVAGPPGQHHLSPVLLHLEIERVLPRIV